VGEVEGMRPEVLGWVWECYWGFDGLWVGMLLEWFSSRKVEIYMKLTEILRLLNALVEIIINKHFIALLFFKVIRD
jgi:hypothetical protein